MKKNYILLLILFFTFAFVKAQVTYTGKPLYNVDVKRGGIFLGTIKLELFPTIAPRHVRNFDSLVGEHFYDSTAFHRVIPNFVIQGGDPNSRHGNPNTWGYGQAGQPTVNAEFSSLKHVRGILSAARSNNINSATSQFFICVATTSNLDNQYSIYGRVIGGMNWVDTVVNASTSSNTVDRPNVKHEMFITAVGSDDAVPDVPTLNTPQNGVMAINPNTSLALKWNAVTGAIMYHLEVATDPAFSNIIKTVNTPNLISTLSAATIEENTKYYWRVFADNGGNVSLQSEVWTFDTNTDAAGIANNSAIAKIEIFPNPSHGSFTFKNIQPGVKLEVFDLAGRHVMESIAKDVTLSIDLHGKDMGMYTYKLSYEGKQISKGKLILE